MTALSRLVAEELALPVEPAVTAMAAALADRYPHAARAVLFYGSCLRERHLDGLMLDFYLIVSDYAAAYGKGWLAVANRVVPPNVFPFAHDGLVAKYAVLSEADLARECSMRARSTSVWARFAQPARLVWCRDEAACAAAVAAVAEAPVTLFRQTLPMVAPGASVLDVWHTGFALTYSAELRAERKERASSLVDHDLDRYLRFGDAVRAKLDAAGEPSVNAPSPAAMRRWRRIRRKGKLLTLLRLAKATTTYAGGVDYLAWKINRHAGTAIAVKPWQRRHPILGALTLLPHLIRSGAIR